jgi:REP element-mobilizing transposase RayT
LTHHCHNREHHLKRARERGVYRKWLLEGVKRFDVCVYAFAITNNHVHVVAHADDLESIPRMMHLAAGSTAKQYNLRKGHYQSGTIARRIGVSINGRISACLREFSPSEDQ